MATRWSPDTCACVIEYDAQINFTATVNACPRHAASADSSAHLTSVLAENQKKNSVVNAIKAATPTAGVRWSINQSTGAMTVSASAIPTATLNNLRSNNPGVTITVDATIPPDAGAL